MADHLVHGGAHRLGERVVIERARVCASLDRRLMDDSINLVRRHPGADGARRFVQNLPPYPARRPGPGDLLLAADGHGVLLLGLPLRERDRGGRVVRQRDPFGDLPGRPDLLGAELARPGEGRRGQKRPARSFIGGVGPLSQGVWLVRCLVLGPRCLFFPRKRDKGLSEVEVGVEREGRKKKKKFGGLLERKKILVLRISCSL